MSERRRPKRKRAPVLRCGCCDGSIRPGKPGPSALFIIAHFEDDAGKASQFVIPSHLECAKASNQFEYDAYLRRN